jgi:hypothetical protein
MRTRWLDGRWAAVVATSGEVGASTVSAEAGEAALSNSTPSAAAALIIEVMRVIDRIDFPPWGRSVLRTPQRLMARSAGIVRYRTGLKTGHPVG